MHTHTRTQTRIHTHTHTRTRTRTRTHAHTHKRTHTQINTLTNEHTHTHTHTYTYIHTHTFIRTRARVHTQTHTDRQTHIEIDLGTVTAQASQESRWGRRVRLEFLCRAVLFWIRANERHVCPCQPGHHDQAGLWWSNLTELRVEDSSSSTYSVSVEWTERILRFIF